MTIRQERVLVEITMHSEACVRRSGVFQENQLLLFIIKSLAIKRKLIVPLKPNGMETPLKDLITDRNYLFKYFYIYFGDKLTYR